MSQEGGGDFGNQKHLNWKREMSFNKEGAETEWETSTGIIRNQNWDETTIIRVKWRWRSQGAVQQDQALCNRQAGSHLFGSSKTSTLGPGWTPHTQLSHFSSSFYIWFSLPHTLVSKLFPDDFCYDYNCTHTHTHCLLKDLLTYWVGCSWFSWKEKVLQNGLLAYIGWKFKFKWFFCWTLRSLNPSFEFSFWQCESIPGPNWSILWVFWRGVSLLQL